MATSIQGRVFMATFRYKALSAQDGEKVRGDIEALSRALAGFDLAAPAVMAQKVLVLCFLRNYDCARQ